MESSRLKSQVLYNRLQALNAKAADANASTVGHLNDMLYQIGGFQNTRAGERKIIKDNDAIHTETGKLISYLHELRVQLIKQAGAAKKQTASAIMLGDARNGFGYQLLAKIGHYSSFLQAINSSLAPIALLPQGVKPKTVDALAQVYFTDESLIGILASLAQLESEVLAFEAEALQGQSEKIAWCGGSMSPIGAYVSAESNEVAAGATYRAEMFLATTLAPKPLSMKVNGQAIPVDKFGHGEITFTANPSSQDRGSIARKSWVGEIKTKWDGKDTVYKVLVPYTVIRRSNSETNLPAH